MPGHEKMPEFLPCFELEADGGTRTQWTLWFRYLPSRKME